MVVLDPFAGSGSALVAAAKLGRKSIGIDLNKKYYDLARSRLERLGAVDWRYLLGDSNKILRKVGDVDYIVTSPPYHNILRNNGKGIRHANGKAYRRGARDGVQVYSDYPNDLGNFDNYEDFLAALSRIMGQALGILRPAGYCTIIISDFTVQRTEMPVQADVIRLMQAQGFEYVGTSALLQTVKPLFPFGYPYAYRINHHHHSMISFRKPGP